MTILRNLPPIIGFAAWSGTGKTTLLEKIIPIFRQNGFKVGVIKHAHHDFDIDHEGKDSYKLRKAGATDTIVASGKRWALIHENQTGKSTSAETDPDLWALVGEIATHPLDIILVEGFKHESIPRIELFRNKQLHDDLASDKNTLMYPDDKEIIAIATDSNDKISHSIRQLDINNPNEIVQFIQHYFSLKPL